MCRYVLWRLSFVLSLFLLCSGTTHSIGDDQNTTGDEPGIGLTIGSKAPALDIEHWVQDGHGKFKPVTEFQPGHVYVVEFWATWCAPCRVSMPHLAETQEKYQNEVQIISISYESLDTVQSFLDEKVPVPEPEQNAEKKSEGNADNKTDGDAEKKTEGNEEKTEGTIEKKVDAGAENKTEGNVEKKTDADAESTTETKTEGKTFRDVTSAYCLTTDPDKSNHVAYMDASLQELIPTAFIVGKDGRVEWIGHPMAIDEPLKAVVEDKWDREPFKAEFIVEQRINAKLIEVSKLVRNGKPMLALKMLDEMLTSAPKAVLPQLNRFKLIIMMQSGDKGVVDFFRSLASDPENEPGLSSMASMVYQFGAGGGQVSDELRAAAIEAAEKAVSVNEGPAKGVVLFTLANLKQQQGDLDAAIKIATQAQEILPNEQVIKDYLELLTKEKEKATSKDTGEKTKDKDKKDTGSDKDTQENPNR